MDRPVKKDKVNYYSKLYFDSFALGSDRESFVAVTEWFNGCGFDIEFSSDNPKIDTKISLTYEQLSALMEIYKEITDEELSD